MSCLKKETKNCLNNQSVAVTIGHKYILNLIQLYKSTFDYICISTPLQIYIYVLDPFPIYVYLGVIRLKRAPRAAGFEPAIRHLDMRAAVIGPSPMLLEMSNEGVNNRRRGLSWVEVLGLDRVVC